MFIKYNSSELPIDIDSVYTDFEEDDSDYRLIQTQWISNPNKKQVDLLLNSVDEYDIEYEMNEEKNIYFEQYNENKIEIVLTNQYK